MTLRSRLAIALAAVFVVLVLVGLLVPRAVRSAQIEQVDRQLEATVPAAIRFTGPDTSFAPFPTGDVAPGELSEVYIARLAGDGSREVIASPPSVDERAPDDTSVESRPGDVVIETVGSQGGSGSWRALTLAPGPGGDVPVLVAIPLDRVDETVAQVQWTMLAAGVVVGLVLLLAGWWVVHLGLRPIRDVTEVADAITSGDRDRRVTVEASGTEAAHLARAFNVMLDEHAASEDQLRQFVADASHELRTPVTSIRGFADLYRQGALDDVDHAMRRIGQESVRMGTLVDDLLLLARLDQGRPLEAAPVDVAAVLADAALDASATHPSRTVTVDAPAPLVVEGDDARLRQVVANLVTNALVHTEGDVSLTGRIADGTCVIEVADAGPGMDREAAARAFDRFWRGDAARTRAGSGLGLSIVAAIVEAHGGRVAMESSPAGGTRVRVALPVGSQEPRTSP